MTGENKNKTLVSIPEGALMFPEVFNPKTDNDGKLVNRSSVYDVARRLPDNVKLKVGRSLRLRVPRLQELVDGQRAA